MRAGAARRIPPLRLSGNDTHCTSSARLHGASDPSALRGGSSIGIRSNPMATMKKTPQRELHDYLSEISEHADVRTGSPMPFGTQERGGGVNFAIFSRNASRVRLELFDHPEDAAAARVIDLDPVLRLSKEEVGFPQCTRRVLIQEIGVSKELQ